MNQHEWIKYGIDNGWCSPPVCYMHDGLPTTPDEDVELDNGFDPCMHIIRMYDDQAMATEVEGNHPPSVWRKAPYTTTEEQF